MDGLDLDFDFGWMPLDGADPLLVLDSLDDAEARLRRRTRDGDDDELLLRALQLAAAGHYANGRIEPCDLALAGAGEVAARLEPPVPTWEIDLGRGLRRFDRGDRAGGEALVRRAGAAARLLRPDLHVAVEMVGLVVAEWIFDGDTRVGRLAFEATQRAMPRGFAAAFVVFAAAFEGDREFATAELEAMLAGGIQPLRSPDSCLPVGLWALALAATRLGDRAAGDRLRPWFEPLRRRIIAPVPVVGFGHPGEWHVGRLEMLAGRLDAAVAALRAAAAQAEACGLVWARGQALVDLARAQHRQGDAAGAAEALAAARAIGRRFGLGWTLLAAAEARAEIEGHEPPARVAASAGVSRLRALAARGGRRVLAAMVEGLDDVALERRFAAPGSQRNLLRAMTQTFQPVRACGFSGLVAYELEPRAVAADGDAPRRWAMELDAEAGEARLLEPAPARVDVTIRAGLAEWVRIVAGVEDALTAMVAGRCSVEGDVVLAVRLEAMFGAA